MAVTHIAGPELEVQGRFRQRCSWCGAVLLEFDLARIARPLNPGEDPENPEPWNPGSFEVGKFVRVDGTNPKSLEVVEPVVHHEHPDSFQIPKDSCLDLDPETTA